MLARTANQEYKQYKKAGGTLCFRDWLDREKEKFESVDGITDNSVFIINDTLNRAVEGMKREGGLAEAPRKTHTLGIPNKTLMIAGGAVAVVALYLIVKKVSE